MQLRRKYKMHWKNMANYDYLGAYSLQGITNEVTLTIKTVKKEKVDFK